MARARWVWEQSNGPLPDDYEVHHKDENRENDVLENLEAMQQDEHRAYHKFSDALDDMVIYERDNSRDVQEVRA